MQIINFNTNNKKRFINADIFTKGDITAGIETEYQTAIEGEKDIVDLPQYIKSSSYFANLIKRTNNGEYQPNKLRELDKFLNENESKIWENSFVIVPKRYINSYAELLIQYDMLKDKSNPESGIRDDAHFFETTNKSGDKCYRFPVSYLLRIALADYLGEEKILTSHTVKVCKKLLDNFSNDNTSLEVTSFYIADDFETNIGESLGKESAKRFLCTQLLTEYSNKKFKLEESGQRVYVYHSPLTPLRQQKLNSLIPDSLYRELFISPCLAGWDKGEEKKKYMELCHLALSRSHLNTIEKLKDAGLIKNNLIVLPNTSNTSLTNNGIHISIGSRKLTEKIKRNNSLFNQSSEKYYSDLVVKIVEHFIPLLTVTYSASPYRIPFNRIHPETILGFLPHELDFTHLRMIYRRWMKKVHNKRFGHRFMPKGPKWVDMILEKGLMLKGDYIPDFRVLDYFVSILSTETAPGLNGKLNNQQMLKKELHEMGVFDEKLSFYALYRGRFVNTNGYSGFEGRFYSCFYDLVKDTEHCTNLQTLFTALAYKYIVEGRIKHTHIPDSPHIESERRQIFFASAIGIPTFYVKNDTNNKFLSYILSHCEKTRNSRRYPGYVRVEIKEYLKALIKIIKKDGADLIENLSVSNSVNDLEGRINDDTLTNAHKISSNILQRFNKKDPLDLNSDFFNAKLESYYRNDLRLKHIKEGLEILKRDLLQKLSKGIRLEIYVNQKHIFENLDDFINSIYQKFENNSLTVEEIKSLLTLLLVDISIEQNRGFEECKSITM